MTEYQKAVLRRRLFLSACAIILILVIALGIFVLKAIKSANDDELDISDLPTESTLSETSDTSSVVSEVSKSRGELEYGLDPKLDCLVLVNADNPLSDAFLGNIEKRLVEIDPQYRNNNNVTQIHKGVYPYITAMVDAAQKDGVDLRVWSPFRSYATQAELFRKQVERVGGDEELAATVVARPGTSEHNTGLCADFNMVSDAFEDTEMYRWMVENAEDFGFVMRYSADKQEITGVIHESWHWRFVGINTAKEMNKKGMCLEEYIKYLKKTNSNYKDDSEWEEIIE